MINIFIVVISIGLKEILTKQITGRYECGEHGKFEYCLEGVPGCVIGCHCHPGYYFDTETKVCESKKHNVDDGPTRRQFDLEVFPTRVTEAELTTVANINEKLNDDLGDWLYNQFFKTVENQVLNETTSDQETPSRRTNNAVPQPNRRSKKRREKKKSKKRRSRKDQRRKLLKIPANDPLWETSGESDSDSSSSSSSRSDSSSESVSSSKEDKKRDKNNGKNPSEKRKSDHDHSKFLIIKKQPKPPLPSFIFLPNVENPFYPSIGLAAAAAMPMYPIVPVPPMPVPGQDGNGGSGGNSDVPAKNVDPSVPNESPNVPSESEKPVEQSTVKPDDENKENNDEDSSPLEAIPNTTEENPPQAPNNSSQITQRLRKRLRKARLNRMQQNAAAAAQLSRRHRKPPRAPLPLPIQTNLPVPTLNEGKFMENVFLNNEPQLPRQVLPASPRPHHRYTPQQILRQAPDKLEGIKYLSQLIRKTHLQTEKSVPRPREDFNNMILQRIENQLRTLQAPPENKLKHNNQLINKITSHLTQILSPQKEESKPSRRMIDNEGDNNDESDAYYANLGRQLASVIKGVIPNSYTDSLALPNSNKNIYSSRLYWDRAVRSPSTQKIPIDITTQGSLYELENKVKFAATDVPFLSLPEIENIIKMVNVEKNQHHDAVHVQVSQTEHNTTRIMNLNLFPKKNELKHKSNNQTRENKIKKTHKKHQHLPVPHSKSKHSTPEPTNKVKALKLTTPSNIEETSVNTLQKDFRIPKLSLENLRNDNHRTHHHHRENVHNHNHNHILLNEIENHTHRNEIDQNKDNNNKKHITHTNRNKHHKPHEDIKNGQHPKRHHIKKHLFPYENSTVDKILEPKENTNMPLKANTKDDVDLNNEKPNGFNINAVVAPNIDNNVNFEEGTEGVNKYEKKTSMALKQPNTDQLEYSNNNGENILPNNLHINQQEFSNMNPNGQNLNANQNIMPNYKPGLNLEVNPYGNNGIRNNDPYLYSNNNGNNINPNINAYLYPNAIPGVNPNLNSIPNINQDVQNLYPNVNPQLSNGIGNIRNQEVPYLYPNVNPGANNNQLGPYLYPNINQGASNTSPNENKGKNLYPNNPEPINNVNIIPNGNQEVTNLYPNNNQNNLKPNTNQIVNYEIPQNGNTEINRNRTHSSRVHHNSRRTISNGTNSYRNYLPKPYTDLTYNIATRRQQRPTYPFPAIFKGGKSDNKIKPKWSDFPGRGLRPYKKPHTPSFRSALFFDDFNK